jgi:hypothetical protein
LQFIAFSLVADVVRCLEVGWVPGCFFSAVISELAPSAYWTNFVNHKAQWMLRVAGFVVVDGSEAAVAYSAGTPLGLKSGTVFPAQVSVG